MTQPAPRRPGRPSVLDTRAVSAGALRLWADRGFATTNWSDLAEATGISTRTLLRHFSSRSEIAWIGVAPATGRLQSALGAASPEQPPAVVVRAAIVESVSRDPQIQELAAGWLRLISSEPELAATAPRIYRPWIDTLSGYLADRLPGSPAAVCRAIATAYQSATFAALIEWAESGAEGDCADSVDRMLRWMDPHLPGSTPD
ncbi:TetR family transcriptional regulator [Nocardia salmonicida]|uniref:acyl-CoA-like ligand-binding transcription factor n=1 Tax=Nocardia TaxID=1817 RepID=UPI00265B1986|nr:TetR family transcriptional regulator [Nocardia sp. PE-7]WKG06969.1 TetR family transcriptional regulator [Nocardia sp. PE-7]